MVHSTVARIHRRAGRKFNTEFELSGGMTRVAKRPIYRLGKNLLHISLRLARTRVAAAESLGHGHIDPERC